MIASNHSIIAKEHTRLLCKFEHGATAQVVLDLHQMILDTTEINQQTLLLEIIHSWLVMVKSWQKIVGVWFLRDTV